MRKHYPATYIFPYLVVHFDHEIVVLRQDRYQDLGIGITGGLLLEAADYRQHEGPDGQEGPVWGNVTGVDAQLRLRHVRGRREIQRALKLAAAHGGYEDHAC